MAFPRLLIRQFKILIPTTPLWHDTRNPHVVRRASSPSEYRAPSPVPLPRRLKSWAATLKYVVKHMARDTAGSYVHIITNYWTLQNQTNWNYKAH